jgi:hypothetical protein
MNFPEAETASVVLRGEPVAVVSYSLERGNAS